MGKILFIILIGAAIYYFFLKPDKKIKDSDNENEFVACDKCGTFVLKKEMKEKNGQLLCKDCYDNS